MRWIEVILCISMPMIALADFTESAWFGEWRSHGVAWGDFDGDGDLDVAVANCHNEQNFLYINSDGTFTEREEFGSRWTTSMAWGDYDNDGDLDMAVGNWSNQHNQLFVNDGDGNFTGRDEFGSGNTETLAWGDYDNDGDLDLAVGNLGQNYLYINDGAGNFDEEEQFGTQYEYTFSLAWGDYDNDGDLDMAVGNNGQNYLYVNDGSGGFDREEQLGGLFTRSVVWFDCDNDGDLDMAVANNDGKNYLFINNGDRTFTEREEFGVNITFALSAGDYDNDGDLDVAVGNNGQNYLYVNNGDATFTEKPEFGTRWSASSAWGDSNNDGDLDLAIVNWGQQNYLYVNNEDDGDYLNLHLVGHYHDYGSGYSNRDGIGAKVYAYEEGYLGDSEHLLGFREIDANGGNCGQDSIEAEFGLPNDDRVDILVVWPGSDGTHIEEAWYGVERGQFLTLHEGEGEDVGIELLSFLAELDGSHIVLRWLIETTEGDEIEGFNLYRREMLERAINESSIFSEWNKVNTSLITGTNPYSYIDDDVRENTHYEYRLEAVLVDDDNENLGTTTVETGRAVSFEIVRLYPNPGSDIVKCIMTVPDLGEIGITMYDISGRMVKREQMYFDSPGEVEAIIDVSELSSGIYNITAEYNGYEKVSKTVVIK